MDGFLVETPQPLREFTVVTRWAVAASHTATHRLRYIVLDEEFDTLLCFREFDTPVLELSNERFTPHVLVSVDSERHWIEERCDSSFR